MSGLRAQEYIRDVADTAVALQQVFETRRFTGADLADPRLNPFGPGLLIQTSQEARELLTAHHQLDAFGSQLILRRANGQLRAIRQRGDSVVVQQATPS